MRAKLYMTQEHNHMAFWRKLSGKLDNTTNKENHDTNMESNLSVTKKKTLKRASRGER